MGTIRYVEVGVFGRCIPDTLFADPAVDPDFRRWREQHGRSAQVAVNKNPESDRRIMAEVAHKDGLHKGPNHAPC